MTIVADNAAVDVLFELLKDPLTSTFAVNEITLLLTSKPKGGKDNGGEEERNIEALCKRYLSFIGAFTGNEDENNFEVLVTFLRGIGEVCLTAPWRKELFARMGLFPTLMTLLTLQTPRYPQRKASIVNECLGIIYHFDEEAFEATVGYGQLKVILFSFVDYLDQASTVDRLFENALKTKRKDSWETLAVRYPRFLHIACELVPRMNDQAAIATVLERLKGLLSFLPNVATCCDSGMFDVVLDTIEALSPDTKDGAENKENGEKKIEEIEREEENEKDEKDEKDEKEDNNETKEGEKSAAVPCKIDVVSLVSQLADIAQMLGSYSLQAGELGHLFRLMSLTVTSPERAALGYRQTHFPYLVRCLHGISSANVGGPSAYFVFNGTTSRIIFPKVEKWPFQKGFTFCAWIRIEASDSSITQGAEAAGRRHLCYFVDDGESGEENAYDIFISANDQLSIETTYYGTKDVYSCSPNSCLPKGKWFFLTLAVTPSAVIPMSGEVKTFINGAQISKASIRYPKLDAVKFGAIGCNSPVPSASSLGFYGQIGAIHLFEEALSSTQIDDIYYNGANYTGSFTSLE